jgi:hypothetical protein
MPLDIGLIMVGMPITNQTKGIIILIHYDLVIYIIRDQMIGAMKLKIKTLYELVLNIIRNQK